MTVDGDGAVDATTALRPPRAVGYCDCVDAASRRIIPCVGSRRACARSGVSDFLCVEPYTARVGKERVWQRKTHQTFPKGCWINCLLDVIQRQHWIPAA